MKEISLSEAMRLMVDEGKVIVVEANYKINTTNRTWEVMFDDGTFQFRCPGDDEWLSPFHFEDEYKYYLQEEKRKYWLWVNSRSGYVSSLYRDEKGRTPELSDGADDISGWIKLPWSEIEL